MSTSAGFASALADALDPSRMLGRLGLESDPWQIELLRNAPSRALLMCARQTGKSTTTGVIALHEAIHNPKSLTLVLSPSQRQSAELLSKTRRLLGDLDEPSHTATESTLSITFRNGSRVIALPGKEATIRGFSAVDLLVLDEAARVDDSLYQSVRPMLAVSGGRLLALSTPFGKRGWFYEAWHGDDSWTRIKVTASDCPRIPAEFLDEERKALGHRWFSQEYECEFVDSTSSAFRSEDIDAALVNNLIPLFDGRGA